MDGFPLQIGNTTGRLHDMEHSTVAHSSQELTNTSHDSDNVPNKKRKVDTTDSNTIVPSKNIVDRSFHGSNLSNLAEDEDNILASVAANHRIAQKLSNSFEVVLKNVLKRSEELLNERLNRAVDPFKKLLPACDDVRKIAATVGLLDNDNKDLFKKCESLEEKVNRVLKKQDDAEGDEEKNKLKSNVDGLLRRYENLEPNAEQVFSGQEYAELKTKENVQDLLKKIEILEKRVSEIEGDSEIKFKIEQIEERLKKQEGTKLDDIDEFKKSLLSELKKDLQKDSFVQRIGNLSLEKFMELKEQVIRKRIDESNQKLLDSFEDSVQSSMKPYVEETLPSKLDAISPQRQKETEQLIEHVVKESMKSFLVSFKEIEEIKKDVTQVSEAQKTIQISNQQIHKKVSRRKAQLQTIYKILDDVIDRINDLEELQKNGA